MNTGRQKHTAYCHSNLELVELQSVHNSNAILQSKLVQSNAVSFKLPAAACMQSAYSAWSAVNVSSD
jgi:hypothetical protein